jgi:Recombination enhancement, RecA-dependent nuclease
MANNRGKPQAGSKMMHKNHVGASKAEKERFVQILSLGCAICGHDNHGSKLEIHHLIDAGRRMGHNFSICLCEWHHRRSGPKNHLKPVSLVDGSKPFTQAYSSQRSLWEATQRRLGLPINWPGTKVLPRRMPLGHDWA